MNQLTSELLLTEIERVLRSNEQFVLDHCVQLNITHVSLPKGGTGKTCDYVDTERFLKDKRCIIQMQNKDDMCCARVIVTAKAKIDGHEQWNSIRQGRRIQEEFALELHAKARVPLHQCGLEDVKMFQRFLVGYQIHVISRELFNGIVYHGPTAEKKIYLYYHDNHYDVITSMTVFLSRTYFCTNCYKVITPKKNTLATTYVIIAERFMIKLKMIGYIVRIVDNTSKDQHALISTRRRRHWETQRVPPITNVRTATNREQTNGRSYLWERLLQDL